MLRFYFFILAILLTPLAASEFNNGYNRHRGAQVTRLKVCGERCSGTNYVSYLLHKNFSCLGAAGQNEFGHKHFMWWFGRPLNDKKLKKLKYTQGDALLTHAGNCLFVVVVRDPYDWLRSFFLKPYDVHKKLLKHGFDHFVKSKWKLTKLYEGADGQHDEIDNRNPWTGKPFKNVLKLRTHKILNYLVLSQLVDNYLFVRYEDVRDDPRGFLDYVSKLFHLPKNEQYVPIDMVIDTRIPPTQPLSGPQKSYIKNPYFPIKPRTLKHINKELDWELEQEIGYSLKTEIN